MWCLSEPNIDGFFCLASFYKLGYLFFIRFEGLIFLGYRVGVIDSPILSFRVAIQ